MLVSSPRRFRSSRMRGLGPEVLAVLTALLAVPLAVSGSVESDHPGEERPGAMTPTAGMRPDPSRASVRINAGGGPYTDGRGALWEADLAYTSRGIAALDSGIAITGTPEPGLFHSTRYHTDPSNPLRYEIPLLAGTYAVRIHSVETWEDMQPGQRQFGIALEGSLVVGDFDVLAATGRVGSVHTHVFEVAVADGGLSIDFVPGVLYPAVGAIEVERIALDETSPSIEGGTRAGPNGRATRGGGSDGATVGRSGSEAAGGDIRGGSAPAGPAAIGAPGKPVLVR